MAEIKADEQEVNARILYWGIPGAGVTSNLHAIHSKLKSSNRGELRRIPTRIDPSVEYEVLPIELGKVNGVRTHLHVIGVPGTSEQSPTRKYLLDRIDGIVFVVDSRPECLEENLASLDELRGSLSDYGHSPDELPFVVQYNKCDLVDEDAIERLHRDLALPGTAAFDAAAKDGTGVLKTLTTISKQVIRHLGRRKDEGIAHEPPPALEPPPLAEIHEPAEAAPETAVPMAQNPVAELEPTDLPPSGPDLMEAAILAEADDPDGADAAATTTMETQAMLDDTWDNLSRSMKPDAGARFGADLKIVSVGVAERTDDRAVRLPIVLGNDDGETVTLALSLQLDLLLDGDT